MKGLLAALGLGLGLALAGCGSATHRPHPAMNGDSLPRGGTESLFTSVRDAVPEPVVKVATVVKVAQTPYGHALVDSKGFALYLFTRDAGRRTSTCTGPCAAAWPPYIVRGHRHAAGAGADARRLGTTRRRDGRLQLTYNGHALYYYVGDKRPGEVLCQAVTEFGGTWYVVDRKGQAITRTS